MFGTGEGLSLGCTSIEKNQTSLTPLIFFNGCVSEELALEC